MKAALAIMTLHAIASGRWVEYDAAVEAWKRGRPMVVVVGADWCEPCKQLKAEAGKIEGVSLVYIDGETDKIAASFPKVAVYPTTYIFRLGRETRIVTGNEPVKLRELVRRALE